MSERTPAQKRYGTRTTTKRYTVDVTSNYAEWTAQAVADLQAHDALVAALSRIATAPHCDGATLADIARAALKQVQS